MRSAKQEPSRSSALEGSGATRANAAERLAAYASPGIIGAAAGMKSRIIYAPILHGSLPFARAVREIFRRERPDGVAVELPETLEVPVERAVRRLPLLSVLRYETSEGPA